MEKINERRRANLLRILETKFEDNQAALARAIERSPTTVWRLLAKGKNQKPIGEKLAREIERLLNIPQYWLDGVARNLHPGPPLPDDVELAPTDARAPHAVPLLSEGQALRWLSGERGQAVERMADIFTNTEVGVDALALIIRGESMAPEFMPGDRVIVDPGVSPEPGDIVLARIGERDLVVRKIKPVTDSLRVFDLHASNPDYAVIHSATKAVDLMGTVVEHHRYRKSRLDK